MMRKSIVAVMLALACAVQARQPEKAPPPDRVEPALTVVKLLDAGKEEGRRPLRFKVEVGQKQVARVTMRVTSAQEIDGEAEPVEAPPAMEMTMVTTVERIGENGEIHMRAGLEDFTFAAAEGKEPPNMKALKSVATAMEKVVGEIVVTDRGITRSIDFKASDGNPMGEQFAAELEKNALQWAVPLPEEPVGPGARWQVFEKDESEGFSSETTVDYTLRELDDKAGKISLELKVEMPKQKMDDEELEGAKMMLDSGEGKGKGECTLSWTRIMPSSMKIAIEIVMSMSTEVEGETMRIKQTMKVECELRPAETAPKP